MGSIGAARSGSNIGQTAPSSISFRNLYTQFNSYRGTPQVEYDGTTYALTKVVEWSRVDQEEKIAGFTFTPQTNIGSKESFFVGDDNKVYNNAAEFTNDNDWDKRHIR